MDRGGVGLGGMIWNVRGGGGGRREYGVEMFYCGVKGEKLVWGVKGGRFMDMMYMGDAINGGMWVMEGDGEGVKEGNGLKMGWMSLEGEMIYGGMRKDVGELEMRYEIDGLKEWIGESWGDWVDEWWGGEEWEWMGEFEVECMSVEMVEKVRGKLNK